MIPGRLGGLVEEGVSDLVGNGEATLRLGVALVHMDDVAGPVRDEAPRFSHLNQLNAADSAQGRQQVNVGWRS